MTVTFWNGRPPTAAEWAWFGAVVVGGFGLSVAVRLLGAPLLGSLADHLADAVAHAGLGLAIGRWLDRDDWTLAVVAAVAAFGVGFFWESHLIGWIKTGFGRMGLSKT